MSVVKEKFTDQLKRYNFLYKNEEVFTECIQNCERFSIMGKIFGPYEKGKKYRIKIFLAIPLIQNDILRVEETDKCDNIDVQRFAMAERDDQRLLERESKYFLSRVKEFKSVTEKLVNEGIKPPVALDIYKSYMTHIIDNRLLKVLKLARSDLSPKDEKRLTNSEKKLFGKLFELIQEWRNFFL